jgi:hypothetical protein
LDEVFEAVTSRPFFANSPSMGDLAVIFLTPLVCEANISSQRRVRELGEGREVVSSRRDGQVKLQQSDRSVE